MKKKAIQLGAAVMGVIMGLSLTACGSSEKTEAGKEETAAVSEAVASEADVSETKEEAKETELIVFAAASMTVTLEKISEIDEEAVPGIKLTFNFDSSGTLKTQIQEGAECDLFISAGQKQMDQLDINSDSQVNTEGLDYILQGSRINLLENKVTLCVADNSQSGIKSFEDMAEQLKNNQVLMAMGNSDVPVGQYTEKILEYFGLNQEELAKAGKITYGTNVKEVTTQISEGSVDFGIVYCTDAFSAGLNVTDEATAEMCGQVIYPAAVLKNSQHQAEAEAFLDFLTGDEAMNIFKEVGFSPAE